MANTTHDLAYFLKKFKAIPASKWCTGFLIKRTNGHDERRCALGHCGVTYHKQWKAPRMTAEADALNAIMWDAYDCDAVSVNDGKGTWGKVAETPRARMITALIGILDKVDPRKGIMR